ncbi:hypothetical protein K505DRAFT_56910 [Melanomma pulvis-pyrius CBS 109.77]|uniref:Mid2 domain-containing protein n=1 Tax=Melanomma pulvis-pyrius CBS 109.77 TaxID=1314802 RepID=A0A6A6X825_9PLEO|nr:hypothetical protein K505DRAFT_56910 [Melanomma pulvis-pyrius CBS 109.77]
MRSSFVFSSALFTASYALAPSCTPSSADPTITSAPEVNFELMRKQNDNRFMGWLSLSGGSYSSKQCDVGGTLYQTASLWRCCATSVAACDIPIGCISGSLIYSLASTGTRQLGTFGCNQIYTEAEDQSFTICNTGFLYENTQDSDPRTNVFCGISSVNWSYYRVKPDLSTSTPASTPSSSPATTTGSTTVTPTPADSTILPTISPNPPKKKSQAWIAGAVVGPIIGLALVGILAWFCLAKRRKNKTVVPPPSTTAPSYPGSPNQQPPQPYNNNYQPPMQQNQHGMAPYGVAQHESWTPAPTPGSPHTQGSVSPHPPNSPYGAPVQPQQWQQQQQLHAPTSPAPGYVDEHGAVKQPHERPFSSELDGTSYQQPAR